MILFIHLCTGYPTKTKQEVNAWKWVTAWDGNTSRLNWDTYLTFIMNYIINILQKQAEVQRIPVQKLKFITLFLLLLSSIVGTLFLNDVMSQNLAKSAVIICLLGLMQASKSTINTNQFWKSVSIKLFPAG